MDAAARSRFQSDGPVTLTDDADECSLIVHDRHAANPPFPKKPRDIPNRRVWFNCNNWRSHNISSFHVSLLTFFRRRSRGISVSGTYAVVLIVPGERKCIDLVQKNSTQVQSARSYVRFVQTWASSRSASLLSTCLLSSIRASTIFTAYEKPVRGDAMVQAAAPDCVPRDRELR
jgi:hypothetical protein